jgi:hypothetical protein
VTWGQVLHSALSMEYSGLASRRMSAPPPVVFGILEVRVR